MLMEKKAKRFRNFNGVLLALLLTISLQFAYAFEPGQPYRLSAELAFDRDVLPDFMFTPDGTSVVYRARGDSGEIDLFQASISGAEVRNLTEEAAQTGDVLGFKISSDSQKIVYLLNDSGDPSLWAKLPDLTRRISGTQVATTPTQLLDFLISDDSSRVVYRAQTSLPFVSNRLFSAQLELPFTSQPVLIGPELPPGGSIQPGYQFVPNSNRVVYLADLLTNNEAELFVSPTDVTGVATRLNPPLVAGGDVQSGFSISPDSRYVVYRADVRIDQVMELYSSTLVFPIQTFKLNPNNLAASEDVLDFKISPDSKRVVYRSDERTDEVSELFSVPISNNGGALAVRISDSLTPEGDVVEYKISPNSSRVVYRADQESDNVFQLFSGLISGLSVFSLTPNFAPDNLVLSYDFNQVGSRVVYHAQISSVEELHSVRVSGGGDITLHPPLELGQNVSRDYKISQNLDRVFYRADQDSNNVFELFSSKIDGPQRSNIRLNTRFSTFSEQDVTHFQISPDGKFLVYRANQNFNQKFELFAVNLDDDGPLCVPIKARNGNLAIVCL